MENISKRFVSSNVLANDKISFGGEKGKIKGLVGENGSGKTTLMLILSGFYQQDEGDIYIKGEKKTIDTSQDAVESGIGMVHQERHLIPAHTVMENILLGRRELGRVPNMKEANRKIKETCEKYGFDIDLHARVENLSTSGKQLAEILKVLFQKPEVLILDEPTSVLTPVEMDNFLKNVKKLGKEEDLCVVLITHKLPVAKDTCDEITVLREGKKIGTVSSEIGIRELCEMMIGREVLFELEREPVKSEDEILRVENLSVKRKGSEEEAVKNVSFDIHEGEILSIVGITGNGQKELVEGIMGLEEITNGKILIDGEEVTNSLVRERWNKGIGYIPSERVAMGIVGEYDLARNMGLTMYYERGFSERGILNYKKLREETSQLISEYDIKAPGVDTPAGHLSGGNIQKLILARILGSEPRLLVAENPTQGLDVGSAERVREILLEMRKMKKGILLVTGNLDEALSISDKIAPIYRGELANLHPTDEISKSEIGLEMLGGEKRGTYS